MTFLEFMEYVKAGGGILAPIFAILWWLERDERKDSQAELKQVAKESAAAMIELKSLVQVLATILKNGTA
jgi:hypothetical protein